MVTSICYLGVSPVLHFIGLTVSRLNQMTYIFILPADLYSSSNRETTSPLLFPLRLSKRKGLAESLFLNEYLILKMISACFWYIPLTYLGPVSYENITRWFQKDWYTFPGFLESCHLYEQHQQQWGPPCTLDNILSTSHVLPPLTLTLTLLAIITTAPELSGVSLRVFYILYSPGTGENILTLSKESSVRSSLCRQLSELNFKKCSSAKWELRNTHPSTAKG